LLGPLLIAVLGITMLAGIAVSAAWEGGRATMPLEAGTSHSARSSLPVTLPLTTSLTLLPLIANGSIILPPPLPPPVPVAVTTPIDVDSVRAALQADGKELRLARIGFHVGPDDGDTDPELLQWMAALDAAGIPFVLKSVDNAEPIMEAQEMMAASGVPHILIYRRSDGGSTHWDVPNYALPPEEAAIVHWERHRDAFPPELDPDRLWLETVNEVDKHQANWLGIFARKTAELAMADGFRWAAFGWSSGEPEPYHWRDPAMLDFLRLAADHPDRVAIALHEYSLSPADVADGYPWLVGRFQLLFEVVDNAGIPRPTVLITEWGWTHTHVPQPQDALPQIAWANWLYAAYPEVLGAAIWYLGPGFGGIASRAQLLISPVQHDSLHNYFVAEPGWGRVDTTLFQP
jgi:hypothetical protein